MAKLRKPRPSATTPAPTTTTTTTTPERATRRAGSIASTPPLVAPIALRTTGPSRASVSVAVAQPDFDAAAEFAAVGSYDSVRFRSNSSTHSSSHDSVSVPKRRRPSIPISGAHVRHGSVASSSEDGTSSALAQLRQRLDSDRDARDATTPNKLRKKQPRQPDQPELRGTGTAVHDDQDEHDEHDDDDDDRDGQGHEQERNWVNSAQERRELVSDGAVDEVTEVETIVMTVVEETEEVIPDDPSKEDESHASVGPLASLATTPLSPQPPAARSLSHPSTMSPEPGSRARPQSLLGSSLLFAPARLGWRVASTTVHFGLDTTKHVVSRVPIVGSRLVSPPPPSPSASTETRRESDREAQSRTLPCPPSPPSPSSQDSFAPSTASAHDRARHRPSHPVGATQSPVSLPPSSPSSTISEPREPIPDRSAKPDHLDHGRRRDGRVERGGSDEEERDEQAGEGGSDDHGIVYKAAELSLGIGIASVLVTGALGKMAWRRVVSRTDNARKEEGW